MLSRQGVNAIVAMAAEVIVGMIAGYITGYLTAKAKLPTFIVTLGISTYIRGMAYVLSTGYPIALSDPLFKSFRSGTVFATPMPVFIVASTYVNAFLPFGYTMFDRHIYAIGGIEEASSPTWIKVGANLIKVYMISGLLLIIGGLNNDLTLLVVSYYWRLVIKGAVIILTVPLDRLQSK